MRHFVLTFQACVNHRRISPSNHFCIEWLTARLLIQITIFDLTYRLPLKIHFQMFTRHEISFTLSYSPSLGTPEKKQEALLYHQVVLQFPELFFFLLNVSNCNRKDHFFQGWRQYREIFVMHTVDLILILEIPYGPPITDKSNS